MGTFPLPGPHLIWPVLQPLSDDSVENTSSLAINSLSPLSGCYSQSVLARCVDIFMCARETQAGSVGACVNRNFRFPTPGK